MSPFGSNRPRLEEPARSRSGLGVTYAAFDSPVPATPSRVT